MRTGADFMKAIKTKYNLRSYSEVATRLSLTRQAVSAIRAGGGVDEQTADTIAHLLGENSFTVYAEIHGSRTNDKIKRKFWQNAISRISIFMIIGFIALFTFRPNPSIASDTSGDKTTSTYYVKL